MGLDMEPASYHPSGTYNLELGARFLENLWAPGIYVTNIMELYYQILQICIVLTHKLFWYCHV